MRTANDRKFIGDTVAEIVTDSVSETNEALVKDMAKLYNVTGLTTISPL